MKRVITIPPFFRPGGLDAVITSVTFELVDENNARVVGFTDQGIVEPETVSVNGETVTVNLDTSATILPLGTKWKVRIAAGRKRFGPWYCTLGAGSEALSLQDLLLAEGLTEEEESAIGGLSTVGLVERLGSGAFQTVELTEAGRAMLLAEDGAAQYALLGITVPDAVYSHTLGTPSIVAGVLTLDFEHKPFGYFRVSLDQDVTSIVATNLATGWMTQLYLEFRQATPAGTTHDVPLSAFLGLSSDVSFDTTWAVYQDATPTIARIMTTDGGATWLGTANA